MWKDLSIQSIEPEIEPHISITPRQSYKATQLDALNGSVGLMTLFMKMVLEQEYNP